VGRDRKRDRVAWVPEAEAREFEEWLRAEENRRKKTADFEFGDRWYLTPAIEDGDRDALADYKRRGFPETPDMRTYDAEVLSGRKRPTKTRPIKAVTRTRQLEIAAFVFDLKQKDERKYIQQAATFFKTYPKAVERAVAAWPNINAEQVAIVFAAKEKDWRRKSDTMSD
jgi:hypothetical protein